MNDDISILTLALAKKYTDEHGGGGGTTNYNDLSNKPQIAGTTLSGNKSLADLGIASANALANKVDKVEGKGLSTNDFTDAYKTAIGDNTNAINAIKDGQSINSFAGVETAFDGVATALATKQNATDSNLQTTADTIVGAINEHEGDISSLKSGLTNLSEEVNGDATVYPYADVITIEDAVPSNLADCSVKIEPVQDLHGYSKPWVGGAGDNKFSGSDNTYTRSYQSATKWLFVDVTLSSEFTGAYYISFDYLLSEVGATGEVLFYGYSNGTQITGNICKMDDKTTSAQWKHFSGLMSKSVTFDAIGCYSDDLISIKNIMVSASEPTTFAPYTNICPISGHTEASLERVGVNIFDPSALETFDATGSGDIRTGHIYNQSGTYTVINNNIQNIFGRVVKKDYSQYGQYVTIQPNTYAQFTVENGYMLYVYYQESAEMSAEKICVRKDSITDFVPYLGQTYTLQLGDTVYGGTVDFNTGVMTVDRAFAVFDGSDDENWTLLDSGKRVGSNILTNAKRAADAQDVLNNVSNQFKAVSPFATYRGNIGFDIDTSGMLHVADGTSNMVINDWKTYLASNTLQVCYELTIPLTVQLTPQQIQLLKGTNTLTASTGQISVTVNGVSGAIGSVQEQVNELAGDVAEIKPMNYSTTEQKTGQKWIDGKDIYVKTISLAETDFTKTNNWFWQKDIEPLITGYETIVKIFGAAIIEFDGSKHLLPFGSELYNVNNSDKCIKFANYYRNIIIKGTPYNDSDINFTTKNLAIVKCNITVAYTKTT